MAKKEALPGFDEAKLGDLSEPISITIHEIVGGRPSPIDIPVKPGFDVPGLGWSHNEVRILDGWIKEQRGAAGGLFYVTATGDNGQQMRWQTYFRAEKMAQQAQAAAQPQQPQAGMNGGGQVVTPPQPVHTWMHVMPQQTYPQPYPMSTPLQPTQQQLFSPTTSPSYLDDLMKEREARQQLEARIERQALENGYKEQLSHITGELRRVQESMSARPSQESDEVRLLRMQLDAAQKERENDRTAQMIREVQQSTQQQIAALTQMIQQQAQTTAQQLAALAQKPSGPDPMITMLIESQKSQATAQLESARLSTEAQKEVARMQAETAREAARNAVGPREMIDIASKFNTGHEQLSAAYTRVMELTQTAVENVLQMQSPGVHPALEMVGQGVQGALGVMERYVAAKENAAVNQSRAVAAVAQAQAQAAVASRGLGAVPQVVDASASAPEEDGEDDDGPSDEEVSAAEQALFGPALESVKRLRQGIASGLPVEQAASALLQGIDHFGKKGAPVAAFLLWQQGEIAKLVDVLVPDAPTSYREQMAAALFEARQAKPKK